MDKAPLAPTPYVPSTPKSAVPIDSKPFYWPVDVSRVRLGPKFMGHAASGTYRAGYGYHTGIDFLGGFGLKVVSIYDGVVISSTPPASARGYGHNIVIDHPGLGIQTRYSHLDSRAVKAGDQVKGGQMIGRLGTSGTDNPHLHWDAILKPLPNPRFNPHNPATGGVRTPLKGLDPIEAALVRQYFMDGLDLLNRKGALNPVTLKFARL